MIEVYKGSTSRTTYIELVDSTTGLPRTGILFSDCTGSYVRTRAARTAITVITQTVTGAYSSGGFVEVDATNQPGVYRLDVPDAALATGVEEVVVTIKATGCRTVSKGFVLVDWNKQVASIPNAAAGAVGGLLTAPTTSNTGLANVTQINGSSAAAATGLTLDFTQALPGSPTAGTVGEALKFADTRLDAAVTTRASQTSVDTIAGYVDTEVAAIKAKTDSLTFTVAGKVDTNVTYVNGLAASLGSGTATAGASSTITLANTEPATADYYKYRLIAIISGTGSGQQRFATAYSTGRVAIVNRAWDTTPDATSVYQIGDSVENLVTVDASGNVTLKSGTHTGATIPTVTTTGTATSVTTVNGLASGVITAASIAADAITDAKVASDVTIASVTGAVGSVTGNVGGNVVGTSGLTAAAIDLIWDELRIGHLTAGTTGEALGILRSMIEADGSEYRYMANALEQAPSGDGGGTVDANIVSVNGISTALPTATAGASTTITLAGTEPTIADYYKYRRIGIVSGAGAGQWRVVTAYTTGRVATVNRAWDVTPDNTSKYQIGDTAEALAYGYAVGQDPGTLTVAALGADTGYAEMILVAGTLNGMILADRFTADALANAPTGGGSAPTAAENADAVWDELLAAHSTIGSASAILSAAAGGGGGGTVNANVVQVLGVDVDPVTEVAADVTKWGGTAVATPHTVGYPVVTIKDGVGAGEIDLDSGAVVTVGSVSTPVEITGVVSANLARINGEAFDTRDLMPLNAIHGSVDDAATTAATFKGDSSLNGTIDDFYIEMVVVFTSGILQGIARAVSGYTASTRAFTFDDPFPAAPADDDPFDIIGKIEAT